MAHRIVGTNADDYIDSTEETTDAIFGKDGQDTIHAGPLSDIVFGGNGDDNIEGGTGADRLFGGDGYDNLYADTVWIDDAVGVDMLFGGAKVDGLYGSLGRDVLFGGADHDDIHGNGGNDILIGGTGGDLFYFPSADEGRDVILDFENGLDVLDIDPDRMHVVDMGPMVRIDYEFGSVILANISDPALIDTSDFLLV
jgi:Ca2+-binding RTX toxin-like protein